MDLLAKNGPPHFVAFQQEQLLNILHVYLCRRRQSCFQRKQNKKKTLQYICSNFKLLMTTTTDSENYFWILQINHKCMLAMLCGTKCYMWCCVLTRWASNLKLQIHTILRLNRKLPIGKYRKLTKEGFLEHIPHMLDFSLFRYQTLN